MLHLDLQITNIRLQMTTDRGKVDASCSQPKDKGTYQAPQNKLIVTPVKVEIDSTACREAWGCYTTAALSQKLAQAGKKAVESGIARRMRQGRQVMENGAKTDAIVNVNWENMLPKKGELRLADVPPPKITVIPSKIEGEIKPGKIQIDIKPGKYNFNFKPAKVQMAVKQYASVKVTVAGNYSIKA